MVSKTSQILRRQRMEITFPTLIDLFAATKQIEGKRPKTISWYTSMLRPFSRFLGEGATIKDMTIHNARAFIASLQERTSRYDGHPLSPKQEGGLSPYTIHGYVRTLKAFGSWLLEEDYTPRNVFARLKRPKLPQPMIEILADREIDSIFSCINPKCFLGARLYTMVLLLLDTGVRASELCSLTLDNVALNEGYMKVTGKGNKERIVPFGTITKKALIRYISTWRLEPESDSVDEVILSVAGTPLTYAGLSKAIKRLGKRAGVPRLHAHLFRHTFAVRYLMNGGDVMTLRLILGHTTLDVTLMYMHLAEAHVKLQHHKFSPVDRLGIGKRGRRRSQR